jgi:hypothetical protein
MELQLLPEHSRHRSHTNHKRGSDKRRQHHNCGRRFACRRHFE